MMPHRSRAAATASAISIASTIDAFELGVHPAGEFATQRQLGIQRNEPLLRCCRIAFAESREGDGPDGSRRSGDEVRQILG